MLYRFAKAGDPYGPPEALKATLTAVEAKVALWGPKYALQPPGGSYGPETGRVRLMAKLRWQLPRADADDLFKVKMGTAKANGPAVFLVKAVEPVVHNVLKFYTGVAVDLDRGNTRMATAAQHLVNLNPRLRCSGWAFTRPVGWSVGDTWWSPGRPLPAGKVWSEHCDWDLPGGEAGTNGLDIAVYHDEQPSKGIDVRGLDLAFDQAITALRKKDIRGGYRIIYKDKEYRASTNWQAGTYGGTRHDSHYHLEMAPIRSGTSADPKGY